MVNVISILKIVKTFIAKNIISVSNLHALPYLIHIVHTFLTYSHYISYYLFFVNRLKSNCKRLFIII